jgi:hypothetical protein
LQTQHSIGRRKLACEKSLNGFRAEFEINGNKITSSCTKAVALSPAGVGGGKDFALLQCPGLENVPSLPITTKVPLAGENVTAVVFNPKTEGKPAIPRVAQGVVTATDQQFFGNKASFEGGIMGGNSGSMVLNGRGQIVGLIWGGREGTNGFYNSMPGILQRIRQNTPQNFENIVANTEHGSESCNGSRMSGTASNSGDSTNENVGQR